MFKLHVSIFYRNKYQMALEWRVCINFAKRRERERDKCFVAPISLQQRKHFIVIRALSEWLVDNWNFSMQCLWRKIQCPNAPNGLGSVYDERYNVQMLQMVWAQTDNPNPPLKDWYGLV